MCNRDSFSNVNEAPCKTLSSSDFYKYDCVDSIVKKSFLQHLIYYSV